MEYFSRYQELIKKEPNLTNEEVEELRWLEGQAQYEDEQDLKYQW
jgi:hypothetical protein